MADGASYAASDTGFGLDEVGVTLGKRGEIVINEYLQTSIPEIYAAGDVTGEPMFVYVAASGGRRPRRMHSQAIAGRSI